MMDMAAQRDSTSDGIQSLRGGGGLHSLGPAARVPESVLAGWETVVEEMCIWRLTGGGCT